MTNIIFTNPEYRELAFRRKGSRSLHPSDQQVRKMVIKEYQNLSFDPDVIAAPSYRQTNNLVTIHEVARRVIENDFINFGDPDHLALIRLSGSILMRLLSVLSAHHTELRLPNILVDTQKAVFVDSSMTLTDQLKFLTHALMFTPYGYSSAYPPIRTYEEIVALAEEPAPSPA